MKESEQKSFDFLRFILNRLVFLALVNYGVVTLWVTGFYIVYEFLGLSRFNRATLTGTLPESPPKGLLVALLRDSAEWSSGMSIGRPSTEFITEFLPVLALYLRMRWLTGS